ncbi:MAG: flagellar FliJ family protein [Undibacterium sp.]|nr:flagellar FliJ family protein [Opitutaceae bacterium]
MKRFRFPLRPVAMLRAHQEMRAREAFGAAVHSYVTAEEEHAAVRVRVTAFEQELFTGRRERFNASVEAENLAAYRQECAAEAESERRVFAAREEMARARAAYLEAHRKVEVVRRLEDKARAAHRVEAAREEQAGFDNFAARRHFGGTQLSRP